MSIFKPNVEKMKKKGDVKGLIKALNYQRGDDAWKVRQAAVEALEQVASLEGDTQAVGSLIAALKDEHWEVRQAAAEALGQIGDAQAVRPLILSLGDIKGSAITALGKIGAPAVKSLITALKDRRFLARTPAIAALAEIGAPAVEPLIAVLQSENPLAHEAAAEALERIGAPAVEPLIAALQEENLQVRGAAARILDSLGWQPDGSENEATYWIAKGQWDKCVEIGAPAMGPLMDALKDKDLQMREAAIETLGQIGAPVVEPLIAALENEDWHMRRAAAEALGQIGDARAVEPLTAALRGEIWGTRRAAAEALGQIGAPAVESLIAVLDWDAPLPGDRDVRQVAARALGQTGDARVVEPLIAALGDKHRDMRGAAAEALEQIGAPAVDPLITALQAQDPHVRRAAAKALGRIGDQRAVEPLIAALKDERLLVIETAAEALNRLGWRPDRSEAGAAYWVAKGEWDKCVAIGAPAVPPLSAALKDDNRNVRLAAAEALGRIGDRRAGGALSAALEDEDGAVRQAATKALVKIGAPADRSEAGAAYWVAQGEWDRCVAIGAPALPPLIAALKKKDWHVRRAAAEALGQIGDRRAVEPLSAALENEKEHVAKVAAEALGRIGDAQAVEPLIVALEGENEYIAQVAAEALGRIGDGQAVEALIAALEDEARAVRQAAATALGQIGARQEDAALRARAVEPLIAAFREERRRVAEEVLDVTAPWRGAPWPGDLRTREKVADLRKGERAVRQAIISALVDIRAAAVEPLITALKDEDEVMRQQAAEALGRIGAGRAVEPLIAALGDGRAFVREGAAKALDELGWQPGQDEAGAAYWVLQGRWDRCVEIGGPAVEPLIVALSDESKHVRCSAAEALVEIYASGELADAQKRSILAQRSKITRSHRDGRKHHDVGQSSCHQDTDRHEDAGIGVDFPL